jgi:hypothetical protein
MKCRAEGGKKTQFDKILLNGTNVAFMVPGGSAE